MNKSIQYRIFWSDSSPLACLSGFSLLIMASDRLAHAIVVVGALVWVYCLTALLVHAGMAAFPQRGRTVLLVFLASFFDGIYLLLLWVFSPLCALQTFFVVAFIPMVCTISHLNKQPGERDFNDVLSDSCSEAMSLGVLIVIFALIREPLGFLSLSLPGGAQGIVLLFSFETESFQSIRLVASSSGALLLLGYCYGLYQYLKSAQSPREEK